MKNFLKLIRFKHWLKNFLVLFPLCFSGLLNDLHYDLLGLACFFAFSFMASVIYIINDIRDVEADRQHPTKCHRPIASGAISKSAAIVVAVLLAAASIALTVAFAMRVYWSLVLLIGYGLLNLAYSLGLKRIPIIDIALLASGYILRVFYGGVFLNIEVSYWLLLCVLALSFFFGLGKRRGELDSVGASLRKSLKGYSREFLDKNMYVFMACGLVFFSLWAYYRFDIGANSGILPLIQVALSVSIASLTCMRYSYDIESDSSDGDPVNVVLSDTLLIALIIIWVLLMFLFIYL